MTLRKVAWCNVWNWSDIDADGVGTKIHLTASLGELGKTLCGRAFPSAEGCPSPVGFCQRCQQKAYQMGYSKGFSKTLDFIP
jgi:hypothetical protein